MIQGYSSNLDVAAGAVYPINNITLKKGCSVVQSGPSSMQLNQRGVYLVHYDGFATATTGGTVSTQLYINGIAQPEAVSTFEAEATADASTLHFETCVQVANNNCNCNLTSSPTVLQFINNGIAVEDAHINVVITKLF
jgi:hypothetical protein